MSKLKLHLVRWLLGGKIPNKPSQAIWDLIDLENQKPEDEIRCHYIEAWEEAAKCVKDFG